MSDDYVYEPVIVPWRDGGAIRNSNGGIISPLRECATEWRIIRPTDDQDSNGTILATCDTEEAAVTKLNEILEAEED